MNTHMKLLQNTPLMHISEMYSWIRLRDLYGITFLRCSPSPSQEHRNETSQVISRKEPVRCDENETTERRRTALHWAAKRGHSSVVQFLLSRGADPSLKSLYGESAFAVAKNDEIRELLSSSTDTSSDIPKVSTLPITPNYLANPPLAAKLQLQDCTTSETSRTISSMANNNVQCFEEELVLKVRTSDPPDQDFIEIEVPMKNLTYENVVRIACEELQIMPKNVLKLRKLPNTVMRKDKDVHRLQNFQEMELVLVGSSRPHTAMTYSSNPKSRVEINGYDRNVSEIASSPFTSKSNYCKNGTILY